MDAFDETGFSSATYKVLYQIAEGATTEETLFQFGGTLHRLLGELIPAKNLYLCLLSDQPGRLNFPYYVDERDGDSMQEMDVPMRRGLTEFVLRSGVTELISAARYAELQRSGEITEATGDLSFNSWLGVPLHIKGQIGGVLTVQSYDADVAYDASDVRLLSFVARHVSTAIERKQSYEALRAAHMELERETSQRRQSEALYRIFYQLAVQAAQGDSLHDFCAKVHELIAQLMAAPCCFISLIDLERNVKNYPYDVHPLDDMFFESENVPMRLGLTEFVFATERPQRVDQARLVQLKRDGLVTQAMGDLSFSAWLGVPLRIRGSVDGVLAIRSYDAGAVYTEADAEVLAHVAHHVSSAIARMQNSEAMQRSERALRRTTFER
jgi:GAF domain-containing protein